MNLSKNSSMFFSRESWSHAAPVDKLNDLVMESLVRKGNALDGFLFEGDLDRTDGGGPMLVLTGVAGRGTLDSNGLMGPSCIGCCLHSGEPLGNWPRVN